MVPSKERTNFKTRTGAQVKLLKNKFNNTKISVLVQATFSCQTTSVKYFYLIVSVLE